jgi:glycosyltransferase involved in cell wall biosynthesis
VRRRVIAHASAVVANSETGAQPWRQRLGGRVPVQVIPNALPVDEVRHAPTLDRARLDLPPDAEVVLYVGRFTPEKNIPMLSEVLLRTLEIRPRALAPCCGEGPQLERFRAQVAARGMAQRCRTLGYRRDVWSIMKLSEVFLSTSEIEGRPNAVVEAMGSGCQLVLSDIPQHREVVTAEAGLFFPRNDADRAVERLCEALDATGEARGARAAAAGRAVEQFSVARMAEAYEALYQSLAPGGGPA